MLPSVILPILASANLFLTPQDPEPWEHLVPDLDARIADSLNTAPLRCISVVKNIGGKVVGSDTTDHWIDGRGRCRTSRTWKYGSTTDLRVLNEWGIHAGLPNDSSRLELSGSEVRTEFQSTPQDPNLRITRRTNGTASGLFADTLVLVRGPQGRLLSRSQKWSRKVDSLWADFDTAGSITRWRIRTENGWGYPSTTHFPLWEGNLLKRDSSIEIHGGAADEEIRTIQHLRCTWSDSLLSGCTTPDVPTDTSVVSWDWNFRTYYSHKSDRQRGPFHLIDTVRIRRDASGHPLELYSTTGSTLHKTWDAQGRLLSTRRIYGSSLLVDSLEYEGTSPLPSLQRTGTTYGLGTAPLSWDSVTTWSWSTTSLSGISARRTTNLYSHLEGRTLRIEGLTGSATLRLSDLSGHVLTQVETDGQDARIKLPAGSRMLIWDVRDARGSVIGQGRLPALR
ncbi:MAG: hypothetical protein RL318_1584 [Fibrobacterota bacterium]|jgi:YD repeat-containing protein